MDMAWAPDSPDLWAPDCGTPNRWAPDSGTPNRWAPDSGGHLTLGRAVELFLAAKAVEGAAAKTLESYGMILCRPVRWQGAGSAASVRSRLPPGMQSVYAIPK